MPNIQETANNNPSTIYQRMLEIFQMLTMITSKEMLYQQDTTMIHKAKLTFRMLLCNQEMENTQLLLLKVNQDIISQRMLRTYQTLTMTTNKEMLSPLDINMILKVKLITRMLLCNQVMENIQSCSLNISTTFQRTPKTYQMLTTITNREMWFQLVTSMILKAKLITRMLLCNQVMADIQSCLTNKKQLLKLNLNQKMRVKTVEMNQIVNQKKKNINHKRILLQFKKKEIMMIQLHQQSPLLDTWARLKEMLTIILMNLEDSLKKKTDLSKNN